MYMDTPDGQKKVLELLELLGLNEWRNVGKSTEGKSYQSHSPA